MPKYAGPFHWADTMLFGPEAADRALRNKTGKGKVPSRVPNDPSYKHQELKLGNPNRNLPSDLKVTEQKAGQKAANFRTGAGFPGQTAQVSGDPPLIPPAGKIDTTQNTTNYSTRSHDEEYVQKLSQWGNNEDIKKAADKGFEIGQTYRAGDPMSEVPAYIRAGSEEYMNRPDMKMWAESNPEAAADLQARGNRREARITAHEKRMSDIGSEYANDGDGPADITSQGAPHEWKSKRLGDMIGAVQKGIMETRGGKDPRSPAATDNVRQTMGELSGEKANVGGEMLDIEESAIIDIMDQNPGMTRGEAVTSIQQGTAGKAPVMARVGSNSYEVSEEAINDVMEQNGMQRNQAIDMIRSEEPMAHLEMGKRFFEPGSNRARTYLSNERTHREQSQFTGTLGNSKMQPQSGLGEAKTQNTPLKYEQGNVHRQEDADLQRNDDQISADRFAWEVNKNVGRQVFGDEYSPIRPMPQY